MREINQVPVSGEPLFAILLQNLRVDVMETGEQVSRNAYYVNNINKIPEKKGNDGQPTKEPIGIIELIWDELYKLRHHNSQLREINDHLIEIVGS